MKITPLEIRQKTFEKNFRGYDKAEVESFLALLAQEWEKISDEKKMLQIHLEQSEKEASKLREVEQSLFKTLKTAEDTGASIIDQANKSAELIRKEAQMSADAIHADSKNNARNILESADAQARVILEDLREDVAALLDSYETLLSQRELLIKNLKNMASDSLENIKKSQEEFRKTDINAHVRLLKELNRQGSYAAVSERAFKETKNPSPTQTLEEIQEPEIPLEEETVDSGEEINPESNYSSPEPKKEQEIEKEIPESKRSKNESGSFFDQFD